MDSMAWSTCLEQSMVWTWCLQVNQLRPEPAVSVIDTDIEAEVVASGAGDDVCYKFQPS